MPKITRLFIIGDSISIQYGPSLERFLPDHLKYSRKTDSGSARAESNLDIPTGANGGDSRMVLEYLRFCRQHQPISTDVLLLNCGLHDIKTDLVTGEKQVPLADYKSNLHAIQHEVALAKWQLVWIRTTPVIDAVHNQPGASFHRHAQDVTAYNAAADQIMAETEVPIIDLHAFSQNLLSDGFSDHVHFTKEVCALQGAFIAGALSAMFTR